MPLIPLCTDRHVHNPPFGTKSVSKFFDLASATSQQLSGINIAGWKRDLCRGRKGRTEPQTSGCEWLFWGRSQVFRSRRLRHSCSSHPGLNTGSDLKGDFKRFTPIQDARFPPSCWECPRSLNAPSEEAVGWAQDWSRSDLCTGHMNSSQRPTPCCPEAPERLQGQRMGNRAAVGKDAG